MQLAAMPYVPSDLTNTASRDLTFKVKQVQEILPQVTDDQACLALAGADDDVMRAVESLLMSAEPEPAPERVAYQPAYQPMADTPPAPVAREPVHIPEPVKKEATANEKELMKWRKKLREIEKIDGMLRKGEKVQPNQLPKLEKRDEVRMQQGA